jgi:hypothetical protein
MVLKTLRKVILITLRKAKVMTQNTSSSLEISGQQAEQDRYLSQVKINEWQQTMLKNPSS